MEEEFLVFLDETGDHSLQHIDRQYPIFGLGAAIFSTDHYINSVNPSFDRVKYNTFGKRGVVLHSTEIRRAKNAFSVLRDPNYRNTFYSDLNSAMNTAQFTFCVSFIEKLKLNEQYAYPDNPYHLTLSFIMERVFYVIRNGNPNVKCRFIAESRGHSENQDLLSAFNNFKDSGTQHMRSSNFDFITGLDFVQKSGNETGHQIVDLCLYPLASTYLKNVCHPSVPVFYDKVYKHPRSDSPIGYGIKAFPHQVTKNLVQVIEEKCNITQV